MESLGRFVLNGATKPHWGMAALTSIVRGMLFGGGGAGDVEHLGLITAEVSCATVSSVR